MKSGKLSVLASLIVASLILIGSASAQPSSKNSTAHRPPSQIAAGIAAYRAGDFDTAWQLLQTVKGDGEAKAQRYLAYMLLDKKVPQSEASVDALELLKSAALAGDYPALIRLETLRQDGVDGPSLADMIGIETVRANAGDPVAAWRLAERFETGDGVDASEADMLKWLAVVAGVDKARFPKAPEAAFRLCEAYALGASAHDPEAARRWCAQAADNGHAGARIVLRRLAQLQG